jgi:hypothetical protein
MARHTWRANGPYLADCSEALEIEAGCPANGSVKTACPQSHARCHLWVTMLLGWIEFYSTSGPTTERRGSADLRSGPRMIINFIKVNEGKRTTLSHWMSKLLTVCRTTQNMLARGYICRKQKDEILGPVSHASRIYPNYPFPKRKREFAAI